MIKRSEIIGTISNIGRNLGAMVFNAFVFFVLGRLDDKTMLLEYSWFLLIANVMVSFTGWGLKDYNTKEYVRNMSEIKNTFSLFFSAKIPLLIICFIAIPFLRFGLYFKIFLVLLISARTIAGLTDSLIIINRKSGRLFFLEFLAYTAGVIFLVYGTLSVNRIILTLTSIEIFKSLTSFIALGGLKTLSFKFSTPFHFLNDTKNYFFVAFFSFWVARADVYVLGLKMEDETFSYYAIVLNLISVSQLVISAFYNNKMKSVYKLDISKANEILGKLTPQFIILSLLATSSVMLIMNFVYCITLPPEFYLLILLNIYFYCYTIRYIYILTHSNKLNYFLIALIISFLANVLLSFIFIPKFGIKGALFSNTISAILLTIQLKFFDIWLSNKKLEEINYLENS